MDVSAPTDLLQATETTATDGAGGSWLPSPVGDAIADMPPYLADAVQAVTIIVVAYVISRLLVQLLGRRIARRYRRPSLTRTVLRGIRVGVFLLAFLTVLRVYGYQLGDIALSVTVFTAVVGVILAPIVGSVISGVFLLADQPYEIGDMIELADRGQQGFVEDITLRYTKIFTLDNSFLVVPNGSMRDRDVINYSAEDTRTRRTLDVLVTYESDVARARELIESAARNVEGVVTGGPDIRVGAARYPAGPTCYIDEFGDHGINLRLRYWITEPDWLLRMRSRIQTAVWESLEDENVEIAYPHQHHVFDETSGEMQVSVAERGERPPAGPPARRDVGPDGSSSGPAHDGEGRPE